MKAQNEKGGYDVLNDRVVFNTVLLPTVLYFAGFELGTVATMVFFTIGYLSIPFFFKGEARTPEIWSKFHSFFYIFMMVYLPIIIISLLKFL